MTAAWLFIVMSWAGALAVFWSALMSRDTSDQGLLLGAAKVVLTIFIMIGSLWVPDLWL